MNLRSIAALAVIVWLPAGSACADIRDDIIAGAARCAQIRDNAQWLDCYYGAAQPMRSQLGLPPAPQAQIRLFTSTTPEILPHPSATQAAFDVRMAGFSFDRNGIFTATLSNGQGWRQLSGDTTQAHWSKPPNDFAYRVQIDHGALGSFNMRIMGLPGSYKVERIQ